MKHNTRHSNPAFRRVSLRAFSLIELLVVIGVIAILAALIFAAMPAISKMRATSTARAELNQLTTAIEQYKVDYGSYPPDNRNNPARNPLYYELSGMIVSNANYVSLDRTHTILMAQVHSAFAIEGLVNASASVAATDDLPAIKNYVPELKPGQYAAVSGNVRGLICSANDEPWNYRSTSATNNPGGFELWIDIVTGGNDTNRIGNWKAQ